MCKHCKKAVEQAMREIKFRAWDTRTSEMIFWKFEDLLERGSYQYPESLDWEVMQFTGLKDKNGKEIYEGDVLKIDCQRFSGSYSSWYQVRNKNHVYVSINHLVHWNEYNCSFELKHDKNEKRKQEKPKGRERITQHVHVYSELRKGITEESEIIGNVYENPELLTDKNV